MSYSGVEGERPQSFGDKYLFPVVPFVLPLWNLSYGAWSVYEMTSELLSDAERVFSATKIQLIQTIARISQIYTAVFGVISLAAAVIYFIDGVKAFGKGLTEHGIDSICATIEWVGSCISGLREFFCLLNEAAISNLGIQVLQTFAIASVLTSIIGIAREVSRIWFIHVHTLNYRVDQNEKTKNLPCTPVHHRFEKFNKAVLNEETSALDEVFCKESHRFFLNHQEDFFNQRFDLNDAFSLTNKELSLYSAFENAQNPEQRNFTRAALTQFYLEVRLRLKEKRTTHILQIIMRVVNIAASVFFLITPLSPIGPILLFVSGGIALTAAIIARYSVESFKQKISELSS